ncbi:MAG: ABC transporter permease [Acidimicrobiia bacterium]|nr:ABC transporter permease [Acidimicrobiia bacterium]MYC57759.1 ABC transporter permease [Acidimicrobiia bacterium]MYI31308.1 ABC transporter permease [Acidimicrobiia bacterium]
MTLWRYSLRSIAGIKIRFALTTLTLIIGVALTVGSLIITDGLQSSLNDLSGRIYEKWDFTVRAASQVGDRNEGVPLLPESLVDELAAIDEIEAITGLAQEFNTVAIDSDGNALDRGLRRQIGYGWPEDASLSTIYVYDDGISRRPNGPDEFAIDHHTGRDNGFIIGQRYDVATPTGTFNFELVGYLYFIDPETKTALQTVSWDMQTTRQLLHDGGGYDLIPGRLAPGASYEQVVAAIKDRLGPDIEVVSQQKQANETNAEFAEGIDLMRNFLLLFAFIILFMSAFIAYNTFTLVMGQRVRELGLLRVLGGGRGQVARVVAAEALMVGIVATILGFGLGILVALGLRGLIEASAGGLPTPDLVINVWAFVAAVIVGVGVAMVTAILPTIQARRITPMVALADNPEINLFQRRRSTIFGSITGGLGLILMLIGLFNNLSTTLLTLLLSLGGLLILLGINISTPALARSTSLFLGWPAERLFNIKGRLARLNAARNPRRTATTASALIVGLALVSLVTVLATSVKQTLNNQLEHSIHADWLICASDCGNELGRFSQQATQIMANMAELESVMAYQFRPEGVQDTNGNKHKLTATDLDSFSLHLDPDLVSGNLSGTGSGDVLVYKDLADDLNLVVGENMVLEFPGQRASSFNVVAIHNEKSVVGPIVIDSNDWDVFMTGGQDSLVTAITAAGVNKDLAQAQLAANLADFPQLTLENQTEYRESRASLIDTLLAIINVFLVFVLLIAVVGIANTMALSIFERIREIGLVKAIGMTKSQIWGAILTESIIVAVFGGLLGITTGVLIGSLAATALPHDIIANPSVPWGTLVVYLLVSAITGMLAAYFPARRANRLSVIDAISQQ